MKFVIQTVSQANIVCTSQPEPQSIWHGLVIYIGIHKNDIVWSDDQIKKVVQDIVELRCMEDTQGKINVNIQDTQWSILLVSNFTLYGSNKKGKRLDFGESARFEDAQSLYTRILQTFNDSGIHCISGVFGDYMTIQSTVTWPINIVLEY